MALQPTGVSTDPAAQPTSSQAVDVVAVLRADTLAQVFPLARPLKGYVNDVSQAMDHPLEDGSVSTDHVVRQPVEIDLPVIITGAEIVREVFDTLMQLYLGGVLLIVQTRAASYSSMIILEMPHEETPDAIDSLTIGLRFRHVLFVKATYGGLAPKNVKSKPKASTTKRGAQQTTKATGPQQAKTSVLYDLFHKGKK